MAGSSKGSKSDSPASKAGSGKDSPAWGSDQDSPSSGKKGKHEGCCNPPPHGVAARKYMTQACDVCPPCHAPCSPAAPPSKAQQEVARLTATLTQLEDGFKQKIAECALLRADAMECREMTERERAVTRDAVARLTELEAKFNKLGEYATTMLRIKEEAIHQVPTMNALKQCYRETREEVDQLRMLLEEQTVQLQDYRAKYQAALQVVEEQKKQMASMEMDNSRIAEQINLEIHSVKLNFQQGLAELSPLPDVLVATQRKLDETYTAKALAEHAACITRDELDAARERVHNLIMLTKDRPKETPAERSGGGEILALVQQRMTMLTEVNASLRAEIDRQKLNSQRLEEAVMVSEKRLQEKMHECAALGGELDRTREEAQRAVRCAEQRHETLHKCMDETVAEMQRQLAETNRHLEIIEKDKASTRCRLMCQLNRLKGRFDMSELRVLGLQTQVDKMIRARPGDGDADKSDTDLLCECRAIDAP